MNHDEAMDLALATAIKGIRGANPLVGAVILGADGELLAAGHHAGAGTPHAEALALAQLEPSQSAGATLVCTLEPCSHVGRMPACSQAIIDAGITTVVYAADDPDQNAAGGAARLRAAGITVISDVRAAEGHELNRRWFAAVRDSRPYTSVRIMQTIDGRIAAVDGSSQWISCPESLAANHALRTRAHAMLVGTGTILADNPRLTARDPDGQLFARQPLRVALGNREVPADAAIRGDGRWLQVKDHDALKAGRTLRAQGVDHLIVEGGAQVTAAFLRADLVDELIVSIAPTVLGSGITAIGDIGVLTLADARHFGWDPAAVPIRHGSDLTLTFIPGPATETEAETATEAKVAVEPNLTVQTGSAEPKMEI